MALDNPLASSLRARAAESGACRAATLVEADIFDLTSRSRRASTRHATCEMGSFIYVCILQSETDSRHFYAAMGDGDKDRDRFSS